MCMFKSAILLKDDVFIPDYDSHSDMLDELKIEDTKKNAETLFVRAELIPKNSDVFSPIDEWQYKVDQDIVPDWYVAEYEEKRMRDAVKKWAVTHIHIGVNNLVVDAGENHYIKDCKNVTIYGNATVKDVYGNATVKSVYGNATVNYVSGNATVKSVYGNATVHYVYGNATVKSVYGNATVNYVSDNATVKSVYGNATVHYVYGNATVKSVYGNATVNYVSDNATVNYVYGNATVKSVYGNAIIASSPFTDWSNKTKVIISQNATFKDNFSKTIWQSGDFKINVIGAENNAK